MDPNTSTKDLLKTLNDIRVGLNKEPIQYWKQGKSKLIALIEKEGSEALEIVEAEPSEEEASEVTDELNNEACVDPVATSTEPKKRQLGLITSMVIDMLVNNPELGYKAIAQRVIDVLPEAKTTHKSVASISRDLKKAGVSVPKRLKITKVGQ